MLAAGSDVIMPRDDVLKTRSGQRWRRIGGDATPEAVRAELRGRADGREMFERMWPLLTPAELLHDLYGSIPLIRSASGRLLSADEQSLLHRPRMASVDEVEWTAADVALLDDAREALGPRPNRAGKIDDADEIRLYGHIVVDE